MKHAPRSAPNENWRMLKSQKCFRLFSSPIFSSLFIRMIQSATTRRLMPSQRLSPRESILCSVKESKINPESRKRLENLLSLASYHSLSSLILDTCFLAYQVEDYAGGGGDYRDDPVAHDHLLSRPAESLEVVMQRSD